MTDIVELAAHAMEHQGYAVTRHAKWIEHRDSGFVIEPVLLKSRPSESGFQSMAGITVRHPQLVPAGVFEYQHTFGGTLDEAISDGIARWAAIDFVVLLGALADEPQQCLTINVSFPQADGPALHRRAVLGPVEHQSIGHVRGAMSGATAESEAEEHSFCSCCFFTNTFETMKPLLEDDRFYAIRMFAARDERGTPHADCRVNGHDWEPGQRALLEYAGAWPDGGLEQRKQYVVCQTRPYGVAS
jgi:hypothetical protein